MLLSLFLGVGQFVAVFVVALGVVFLLAWGVCAALDAIEQERERRRQARIAVIRADLAATRVRLEQATRRLAQELDAACAEASAEMTRQALRAIGERVDS